MRKVLIFGHGIGLSALVTASLNYSDSVIVVGDTIDLSEETIHRQPQPPACLNEPSKYGEIAAAVKSDRYIEPPKNFITGKILPPRKRQK